MKHVIEGFSALFLLLLNLVLCVSVLSVSARVAEAKEYKALVVAEIENSNFNPNVISSCVAEAQEQGYLLEIETCMFGEDDNRQLAEICLTYHYEIPLLGIEGERVTRGMAR